MDIIENKPNKQQMPVEDVINSVLTNAGLTVVGG